MRYDTEHKQRTHERLLKVAAAAIRRDGPDNVAVAGVMAEAGLTHGGFYAHFKSKEGLIEAAIGQMFEESRARALKEMGGRDAKQALTSYIAFYLSPRHRDARDAGCPVAALASDLSRMQPPARERFADGADRLRGTLEAQLALLGHADARAQADSMLAELVGALALARAEPDAERSDAILAHSRAALQRRFGLEE